MTACSAAIASAADCLLDRLLGGLVQREMESWRAPLASIAPITPGRFAPPKVMAAGGSGSD